MPDEPLFPNDRPLHEIWDVRPQSPAPLPRESPSVFYLTQAPALGRQQKGATGNKKKKDRNTVFLSFSFCHPTQSIAAFLNQSESLTLLISYKRQWLSISIFSLTMYTLCSASPSHGHTQGRSHRAFSTGREQDWPYTSSHKATRSHQGPQHHHQAVTSALSPSRACCPLQPFPSCSPGTAFYYLSSYFQLNI